MSPRLEAVLGPGGVRGVVPIAVLAVLRAVALVLIAEGLATSIAALADGTADWRTGTVLAVSGVLLRAGVGWLLPVASARVAIAAKTGLRAELAARIVRDGRADGSDTLLATAGLDDLDEYYGSVIPATISALVVPVVLALRILAVDWLSALVIAVTLPLVPLFMVLIGLHTRERTDAAAGALDRLADHLVELARGLPVLVGLGRVEEQTAALAGIQEEYRRRTHRTLRVAFLSALALELLATLSVAVVAVVLGIRLLEGDVSLAVALVVLLLAPDCFGALRDVGTAFHAAQDGRGALRRARELLASPARMASRRRGPVVRLEALEVRYPGRAVPALASLNTSFPLGRVTAVTGASGAGKSTLLAALTGTLPAEAEQRGWVHGVDAGAVAYAPQAPRAFAATARDELLLYAGRAAAVPPMLERLGLEAVADAPVAALSPGELRRVAVARALLRVQAGATLLVLDEPTAHLDEASAQSVRSAIQSLRHVTVVLVSHDAATLVLADRVLALDDSRPAAVSASDVPTAAAARALPPVVSSPGDAWATLRGLVRPSAGRWVLAVVLGLLAAGFGLALTAVSGWLIVRAGQQPAIMFLLVAIVGVRFFGIGRSVARYAERLASHDAVFAATDALRLRLWRGIAARGAGSRDLLEGGSALDYLVVVTAQVRDALPRILTPGLVGLLTVLGVTVTTALVLPGVAPLVGVALTATLLAACAAAAAHDAAAQRARVGVRSELVRRIGALGAAADDLRANGVAERALQRVAATDAERVRTERRTAHSRGLADALAVLGTGLLAAAVPAVATGAPAELVAVIALLAVACLEPIAAAAGAARLAPGLVAALRRLAPLAAPVADRATATTPSAPVRRLELDAVLAGPLDIPASAEVEAGEWLIVDGPSGSGKTTLLSVLLGALEPRSGGVLAAGVDLAALEAAGWRRRVAWCPQEAHVFDSTIRANLLIARGRDRAVSDTEMLAVLERVGLGGLLAGLRDGLDARLGSGGHALSGGERQRLAVARSLLSDADILLLDEPTAHLDEPTARRMMADIRRATGDRIVVLVSHRASDREPEDRVLRLGEPAVVARA